MCKNPLALYLILGKRIGDSVSGRIGDSVSVFSSMAALLAWQLPVFDRGKSHILKDARLRRNIFIFIGPWSARLPTGMQGTWGYSNLQFAAILQIILFVSGSSRFRIGLACLDVRAQKRSLRPWLALKVFRPRFCHWPGDESVRSTVWPRSFKCWMTSGSTILSQRLPHPTLSPATTQWWKWRRLTTSWHLKNGFTLNVVNHADKLSIVYPKKKEREKKGLSHNVRSRTCVSQRAFRTSARTDGANQGRWGRISEPSTVVMSC